MSQITQSQPMGLPVESWQLTLPLTNSQIHSQIAPEAVWKLLNTQQQELLFQKLALVCCSLIKPTAPPEAIKEALDESA